MANGAYILSSAADNDLEDIFDYTLRRYGLNQAIKYLTELEVVFDKLSVNPYIGKSRDEVKSGLRSFPKQEHVIFYRQLDLASIYIVRVLHSSRDIYPLL